MNMQEEKLSEIKEFDFALALRLWQEGKSLARRDWNGLKAGLKMEIHLVPGLVDEGITYREHLVMIAENISQPYLPTTVDLFAKDWFIIK